jgi:hypothetical protein
MNASSSKTLVIALGGLGLLFVVAAANKAKAAQQAKDEDPDASPPGPPIPLPNSLPATNPQPPAASVPLPAPDLEAPAVSLPVTNPPPTLPLPSLDPLLDPPGPPAPSSLQPVVLAPAPSPAPAAPSSPSMPTYPVSVPAAAATPKLPPKRPFGDQPLDVQAGQSNVAPPKAAPAPASKRSAQQAALDLLGYVTPILAAKRGAELGVKGQPNPIVKAAQLDMGDVPADGIYGPRTRAKGKALISKNFPARV